MKHDTEILGVRVNTLSTVQVLETVEGFLQSSGQCHIVTVNPEFIMAAQDSERFREILNKAGLIEILKKI